MIIPIKKLTDLCKIMNRNGSDKGQVSFGYFNPLINHSYTKVYYDLFSPIRYKKIRLFEMGITFRRPEENRSSLYGWRDFFPNAVVFGADIDRNKLFQSDQIKTFYCDQTSSESIENLWKNEELLEDMDIIIDDGLHEPRANICLLERSIHKIRKGGFYIIEDIYVHCLEEMGRAIEKWKTMFPHIVFEIVQLDKKVMMTTI